MTSNLEILFMKKIDTLCVWVFCLYLCLCTTCMSGTHGGQTFTVTSRYEACQDLNLGPLEEHLVLLITGPSLQPSIWYLFIWNKCRGQKSELCFLTEEKRIVLCLNNPQSYKMPPSNTHTWRIPWGTFCFANLEAQITIAKVVKELSKVAGKGMKSTMMLLWVC